MKILDVWSLHYEQFLIQIEGTQEEKEFFEKMLKERFPDKIFYIHRVVRGLD